ncbi:hypothetical protein HXX76_010181 [Chlamydomonas incerta]|uniref:Fatty acid desaturase domain-containing protein n=1 Tax=Chlamydomonas incerta TaxID=51695 RepID=A0A835SRK6_CHLIN|nr:hypothetical protein HXX76_010181 [Chlamydomonas incerta]|eukprot:KAG2430082.1 hypothetical protein HXX76_010181 [Chlamydomonas incerta]
MGGVVRTTPAPAAHSRAGAPARSPHTPHVSPLTSVQPVASTVANAGEASAASSRASSGAACSSSGSSAVASGGPVRGLGRPLPSAALRRRQGVAPIAAVGTPAVGSGSGVTDGGAGGSTGAGNGSDAAAAAAAAASAPMPAAAAAAASSPNNHHPHGSSNGGNGNSAAASATTSTTTTPEAAAASPSDPAPAPEPLPAAASTSLDGLPETQKYVYADEWGFSRVGADFPPGSHPSLFSQLLPQGLFAFDARAAAAAVAVPLAAMAAGYGWLWYMHSIAPVWQQALCAALIGTGYAGLFKVAHECAMLRFMPQMPGLQAALGTLLMAPSLYSLPSWRLHHLHHLLHTNMLWEDVWGWHPLTKVELAEEMVRSGGSGGGALAAARLVLTTPLKLFASIGHWLRSWDGLDLRHFHPGSYVEVLSGWAAPLAFAGLALPAIVSAGGLSGFVSCYLAPWLVFHFWLSVLSLTSHTAPHIPWRAEGDGWDAGRATVAGTVTLRLPRPLEVLLNNANYMLPQAVAPGLPLWSAPAAYAVLAARLGPYMTEGPLSLKLLTNHVTKWQIYDEEAHTYRPMEEVVGEIEADLQQLAAAALDAQQQLEGEDQAAKAQQAGGEEGGAAGMPAPA